MKIALLTGGGDAPGLNGIIESTSRALLGAGYELVGILDGFEGILDGRTKPITLERIEGIHQEAGTLLGTSNKSNLTGRETEFIRKYEALGVEGIIAAGGDGTFAALSKVGPKIPLLGVPKTIDNDLAGTEITFGYDTACGVVAEAIDALRATANAHRRVMVVEAMGRTAGWIALGGGLASYADVILIPERPFSRAKLLEFIRAKQKSGQRGLMIVVSEGSAAEGEKPEVAFRVAESVQQERFGGIAERLARWIEKETGWESRHVVLGHLQRSAHPSTTDRFLTLAMGVEIARMVQEKAWGNAAVYRAGQVTRAPITDLQQPPRLVTHDHRWVKLAQAVGLFI
jgi:6-phosphofructokinase 1